MFEPLVKGWLSDAERLRRSLSRHAAAFHESLDLQHQVGPEKQGVGLVLQEANILQEVARAPHDPIPFAHTLRLVDDHAFFASLCARFRSIGWIDRRRPVAARIAFKLRSSGFPRFESIR